MEAKMWNISGWLPIGNQTDGDLDIKWNQILTESDFTVLNFVDHVFEPFGWTALWLLGESHFAIHTFPEEDKYYWELSSCIKDKYNNFILEMEKWHGV